MPSFLAPQVFAIADVASLDLTHGPVSVDISHLANEAHTEAFVAIFEKVLRDNAAALDGWTLSAVIGQHTISNAPVPLSVPVPFDTLARKSRDAALCLYFSHNDEIILTFTKANAKQSLFVAFDNPYFRLQ